MTKNKISVWAAIALNINIIIGSAFFIGVSGISQKSGALAPITWIILGFVVFPIVLVIAELAKLYPHAGGLYIYSKRELSSFWGFISGWGYYIGTIAGNALIIHSFGLGLQRLGLTPGISSMSLDLILITIFTVVNLANVNFFEKAQLTFAAIKAIPLLLVVISSLFIFKFRNVTSAPISLSGFFDSIPLVLFAYIGFEACCAIAHQIENSKKNAPRAILGSFLAIMVIYGVVQFGLLGILGPNTTQPFLEILSKLTSNNLVESIGNIIIDLAIISSYLGGYYGMFYANNWVLYAIAKEKNITFSGAFTKMNKYQIPWISVVLQGVLTATFIIITQDTDTLVNMTNIGLFLAYFLSILAFMAFFIKKQKNKKMLSLGVVAAISCSYLIYYSTIDLLKSGILPLISFLVILGIGVVLNKISVRKLG